MQQCTDNYFKVIAPSGVLFIIAATFTGNSQLFTIGFVTFLYGIIVWMLHSLTAALQNIVFLSKWKIKQEYIGLSYILLSIIAFVVYVSLLLN